MTLPDLAIFTGSVHHCRRQPHPYHFRQPLLMLFVNAEHFDAARQQIAPFAKIGLLNWRRNDYLPDSRPLADTAIDALYKITGKRAAGPVYVLAQARQFGVSYNPAAFYFICDGSNACAAHLLVEVHNTPWGERFCYAGSYNGAPVANSQMAKHSRVSPFNPPKMTYQWRYNQPADKFFIRMRCTSEGGETFDATMLMRRQAFSRANLIKAVLRQPLSSGFAFAAIYWHAFRLWLKKTPLYREQFAARYNNKS